ncbi:MAG: hypothetical protein SFV32_07690 [Opitutaceae bacterium]|nr:hypothetical protein [Opitutaceae bacterium]
MTGSESVSSAGKAHRRVFALGWVLFAAVVALVWYTAPRGFDLLDSGCYYLEYAFPDDSADTHTSYRYFAAPIYSVVGGDIVAFRWVSWVGLWASVAVLGWGWLLLSRQLERQSGTWELGYGGLLLVVLHASSAMYTIKPAALTYNSLNLIAVNAALGFFCAALAGLGDSGPRATLRPLLFAGVAFSTAAVDFFIKPTTSAFLLVSLLVFPLVAPTVPGPWKKRLIFSALAAALLGSLGMFAMLGGVDGITTRFASLIGILKNSAYMDVLLTRTLREFGELRDFLKSDLPLMLGVLFAGGLAAACLWGRQRAQELVAAATGAAVVILWIHRVVDAGLWKGSHQLYMHGYVARSYLSLLLAALVALGVSWVAQRRWREPSGDVRSTITLSLLFCLLVATPFAGAFGSTTSVYLNGALYASSWTLALLVVLGRLASWWRTPWVYAATFLPLAGVSVAQLFHGQVMMPYMVTRPLWEHTVPVKFGLAESELLVDPETAGYIEKTRSVLLANGFSKGDDIFCFFNVPGLVYAVGGRSPVIPWYFGRIYVGDPVEEYYMRRAGPDRVRKAWLITQDDVRKFSDHFHKGGIAFPDGYERLAQFNSPFTALDIGIWKPRDPVAAP